MQQKNGSHFHANSINRRLKIVSHNNHRYYIFLVFLSYCVTAAVVCFILNLKLIANS